MPGGGFRGGGFGRGGPGGPPAFRGSGLRVGCFGGLFGPLIAGVLGFLLGRNLSSTNPQPESSSREEDLRRREEDVRRREEALRNAEDQRRGDDR